ncbi:MAG: flap endonuclease-1 [Nanoarchaeota archaeon]|nr:flap endonuclease-1 [Nanoarchaeota archaeon]
MGVSFSGLIEATPITFDDLRGHTIAIDAYNTMYQFLATIRDRFTGEPLRDREGRVTSHLTGLFNRTLRLLEAEVTPVYVFDGKPPAWKQDTLNQRRKIKEAAAEQLEHARKTGDVEKIRMYAQATSRLTPEMADEAKKLLSALGVAWIQAPSEGEAQAVRLAQENKVWAVGSQDWDSLLFGAERLIRNLTVSGRKKVPRKELYVEVVPELVQLSHVLKSLTISHDQLILLGILIGTDYNAGGVLGFGPKKALKAVKEHPTPTALQAAVEWAFPMSIADLFDFFKHPPTEQYAIPKGKQDLDAVKQLLVHEHDFSEERVSSSLAKLSKIKKGQSRLELFLKK